MQLPGEQSHRWRGGEVFRVEALVAYHPSLSGDREAMLQLV
jgi:hypothetical protein